MPGPRGRPRKPADERRDAYVRVRVTRAELKKLKASARKAGTKFAFWIRRKLFADEAC